MPFWDQTGDADGGGRGNYFSGEGDYDVVIEAVKHRNGYRGESVIVKVEVLTSTNEEVEPGSTKSCAFNISKQPVLALNNIKAFVCGIYGLDASKKDPDTKAKVNLVSRRMVEEDNPLAGVKVHLTTFMTKTAKGGDFTNLDWTPYLAEAGYAAPMPSAAAGPFTPPVPAAPRPPPGPAAPPPPQAPPAPPETYHPAGTAPGRGATHVLRNGGWVPL